MAATWHGFVSRVDKQIFTTTKIQELHNPQFRRTILDFKPRRCVLSYLEESKFLAFTFNSTLRTCNDHEESFFGVKNPFNQNGPLINPYHV